MARKYNYTNKSEFDATASLRRAWNVTPALEDSNGFDIFPIYTRAIMVSAECTVTGVLANEDTTHTTFTLTPGILYPFSFKAITAVSAGTVKAYA